jgi:hypothetical protein
MSSKEPTPDDLRTIADNLHAEGQTSRAEVLTNAAEQLAALEAENKALREALKPFADAYEMEKDSHLSPIVCLRNMLLLTIYGDWKSAAEALKGSK